MDFMKDVQSGLMISISVIMSVLQEKILSDHMINLLERTEA